jgi:DNA-binding GntR family transcriptional regulator
LNEPTLIVRRSLHDEVVLQLRDLIVEGFLKPGEKIQEAALCRQFGVSRTPLREALKALAAEGLLTLLPNRGAIVAKITPEAITELFPIMGALEALAGELACGSITEEALAELWVAHRHMVAHYERGEWAAYSKLNRGIHEAIFAAAGNPSLTALYHQLQVRTHSVRLIAQKSAARWQEAVEDHEKIMAALEQRDGKALAQTMIMHLQHKAETVKEAMAASG